MEYSTPLRCGQQVPSAGSVFRKQKQITYLAIIFGLSPTQQENNITEKNKNT
jgi:hypothetical protein